MPAPETSRRGLLHAEPSQLAPAVDAASLMARSLLFSLQRQYLDLPLDESKHFRPGKQPTRTETPYFLQLEQVGDLPADSQHQPLVALQTALASCHSPGRNTLIFLAAGDGRSNRIFLGLRGQDPSSYTGQSIDLLGKFFHGNWPGTRLRLAPVDDADFDHFVRKPMQHELRHAVALTGIPALKAGDAGGYPQGLDRLLSGLRSVPFLYMVVAEPVSNPEVDDIIYRCRDLLSWTHAIVRTTAGESRSEGQAKSESRSESWSQSESKEETEKTITTDARTVLIGATLATGPAAFLAAFAAGNFGNEPVITLWRSHQVKTGVTKTTGGNRGEETTVSSGIERALSREYLDAHAEAAEELLEQSIDRLEQARASGCWNVGVYFLAPHAELAQFGAAQLRSLLSGQKTQFEPVRLHSLAHLLQKGAKDALREFDQPVVTLADPRAPGEELEHPLGPAFGGLTTPLNTEELAMLVNLPRHSVPGIPVIPVATFSLDARDPQPGDIWLGELLEGGQKTDLAYSVPQPVLTGHVLVTGRSGSGKAATCRRLLADLHERQIPFLVIESEGDEFVQWARRMTPGKRITTYTPGLVADDALRINPFDLVCTSESDRPRVRSHLARIAPLLASFLGQEPSALLEDALLQVYRKPFDWLADERPPFDAPRPTLSQFLLQLTALDAGRGMAGTLARRLSMTLDSGAVNGLLDVAQSSPWSELFDRPAVISLAHLEDPGAAAFTAALLVLFLLEYRRAQGRDQEKPGLRHAIVLTDAARCFAAPGIGELFASVLDELRAYRQGAILIEQHPSRLPSSILQGVDLHIAHRLTPGPDQAALANRMLLTPEQVAVLNQLANDQAVVRGPLDALAAWVKIDGDRHGGAG